MEQDGDLIRKLAGNREQAPFPVPGNYFDSFSSRLQERLHKHKKPVYVWKKILWLPAGISAAIVALLFLLYPAAPPSHNLSEEEAIISQLSVEEVDEIVTSIAVEDDLQQELENAYISEKELEEFVLEDVSLEMIHEELNHTSL